MRPSKRLYFGVRFGVCFGVRRDEHVTSATIGQYAAA